MAVLHVEHALTSWRAGVAALGLELASRASTALAGLADALPGSGWLARRNARLLEREIRRLEELSPHLLKDIGVWHLAYDLPDAEGEGGPARF